MIKKLFTLIKWSIAMIVLWVSLTGVMIWSYGSKDFAVPSDCIIVLGAAISGNHPSPVFEERLNHAVSLFQGQKAPSIIFTGGLGKGEQYAESEVGAAFAVNQGIPQRAILIERQSRTTRQNLLESQALMEANQLRSAIIVSDPLHLKRAALMAKSIGLNAVTSPTPTSRYRSLKTKFGFLFREIYFYSHYLVFKE